MLICFAGNQRDGIRQAPRDKQNARTMSWMLGRLTDTSDLYKGSVMLGTQRCSPRALRALE